MIEVAGQRRLQGLSSAFLRWGSIAIVGYHLYGAQFGLPEAQKFRPMHVAMYCALIFLAYGWRRADRRTSVPWWDWGLFALAWVPVIYIYADYERIAYERYPLVEPLVPMDWVAGLIALFLVVEACRRTVGLTLLVLLAVFVSQALFGPYFPAPFDSSAWTPMRLVDHLFMTSTGLYGSITNISGTFVLMFVLLGAVLEQARGGELFMNIAIAAMGKAKGGPAKAAVLASALFGSISGAATANVYATGTFTIPLMIKTGFKPRFAGAVEAVASASGQLVPPIMGSAAFLIADFTGTEFTDVAFAAALPAFLYLFAVYFMVTLEARRGDLPGMEAATVREARQGIVRDLHMGLVLVVVVALLIYRFTPFTAAYYGVVATIVLSMASQHTRLTVKRLFDGFEIGARRIAPIAAALFVAALVVGVIELTGLGLRFTSILLGFTGGNLFLTMVLVMLSCIVLGMGLPTAAAYMVVAIFGAPALIKLGVEPLAAHFFVFYYAIISAITPPVAIAAYAAATIAQTPLQATGLTAMKLGAAVYLVPFVIVYSPALLLIGDTAEVLQALVSAIVGIVALAACVQGYLLAGMGLIQRAAAAVSALALMHGGWQTDLAGAALLAGLFGYQYLRKSRRSA
jgi:TRAP transporter 4TM/12TM fusion protein